MINRIFCSIFLLFTVVTLFAQEKSNYSIEPYIGLSIPINNVGGDLVHETAGLNAGLEVRKNLSSSPISIGANVFVTSAFRKEEKIDGSHSKNSQRIAGITAVCNYQFFQGQPISFFIGTGIGVAQRRTIISGIDKNIGICPAYGLVVSPRIGVELSEHFRVSLETCITQRDYNVAAFRVGYAFGRSKR